MTSALRVVAVICLATVAVFGVTVDHCKWWENKDYTPVSIGDNVTNLTGEYACYSHCTCTERGWFWCFHVDCPTPRCAEKDRIPDGECCEKCTKPAKCIYGGRYYDVDDSMAQNPPAYKCYEPCVCGADGHFHCDKKICSPPPCAEADRVLPDGECCEQCLDTAPVQCYLNGTVYPVGQSIPPPNDCYTSCTCLHNGTTQCNKVTCERPKCAKKTWLPADIKKQECCSKCPSGAPPICFSKGTEYAVGVEMPPDIILDCQSPSLAIPCSCYKCSCKNTGEIFCTTAGGDCCIKHGKSYLEGQEMPVPNNCSTACTCIKGGIRHCSHPTCQRPNCAQKLWIQPDYKKNVCCPHCPAGAEPTCFYNHEDYALGETVPYSLPCYICKCKQDESTMQAKIYCDQDPNC